MIQRELQSYVEKWLFKGKVLVIYGPRRVGKTTLSKLVLAKYGDPKDYLDCDQLEVRQALESQDKNRLKSFIGNTKFVVIDEAQRVHNIGLNLKILIDHFPDLQIIATGSSSFDLANKINEPLTGRHIQFFLGALSVKEIEQVYSVREIPSQISQFLRFGMYPDIVLGQDISAAQVLLQNIASNYLYKDILEFEQIKKSDILIKLLQALALQIGNEVSDNELAGLLKCSRDTINRYLLLLEKSFVIFRVGSFARNLRNELKMSKKIYFYDLGIRNALINNFNDLNLRTDTGVLWENFLIAERQKHLHNSLLFRNVYFWRTSGQQEIDYIEEYDGKLHAYEFKWGEKPIKAPKSFVQAYPESSFSLINQKNFLDFVS